MFTASLVQQFTPTPTQVFGDEVLITEAFDTLLDAYTWAFDLSWDSLIRCMTEREKEFSRFYIRLQDDNPREESVYITVPVSPGDDRNGRLYHTLYSNHSAWGLAENAPKSGEIRIVSSTPLRYSGFGRDGMENGAMLAATKPRSIKTAILKKKRKYISLVGTTEQAMMDTLKVSSWKLVEDIFFAPCYELMFPFKGGYAIAPANEKNGEGFCSYFRGLVLERDWPEYLKRWKECTKQLAGYYMTHEDPSSREYQWANDTLAYLLLETLKQDGKEG